MVELNAAYSSIDPRFRPTVLEILEKLEARGYQPIVVEGKRTLAQQREKVRLGYSTTMNSYHLTGLAADICDKREMWDKGLVRPFFNDLFLIASTIAVPKGKIECGLIWLHPERYEVYKQTLTDLLANKITQKQADAKITWFCDAAHIQLNNA